MWLQEEEGGGLLKEGGGGSHQHSGIRHTVSSSSSFYLLSPFFKKEILSSICFQRIRHVFDSTLFILHISLLAPLIFNGFKLYKGERWE